MTTTEWVGRYNEAFEQAGLFQNPNSKFLRGPAYLPGTFKRLPPINWAPSPETISNLFYNDPMEGVAEATKRTMKVNARLDDPWKSLPAIYSQFEPKEVVDDGKVGQKALNQKESL